MNYTAGVLKTNFPELRRDDREFGKQLAAVDAFILVHEFGHALIHAFELPVLGREEDAADAVATVFLTRAVEEWSRVRVRRGALLQRAVEPASATSRRRTSSTSTRSTSSVRTASSAGSRGSSEQSYREVARRGLLERGAPAALPGRVPAEGQLPSRSCCSRTYAADRPQAAAEEDEIRREQAVALGLLGADDLRGPCWP